MLAVSEPGALNCYIFIRPVLLILPVSRNQIITHLSLSRSLGSLLCDLITPTPGLAFFIVMPRTLAASSFLSGRAYPSLDFLPPLSLLESYSDYVGVNISLSNFPSLSFLNVYAPPICSSLTDGRNNSFFPSILYSCRNLFILGDFNCHHPSGTEKVLPTLMGRKYSIGSSLLTSSPLNEPNIPTLFHRSSGSRSSLDISFAPFSLAPGRCFRTWVLITYQFFYLSFFLRSSTSKSVPILQFSESSLG